VAWPLSLSLKNINRMENPKFSQLADMETAYVPVQGLTDQEAAARLRQYGYNELPSKQQRTVLHIVAEVLREPMFLLLMAAGAIYLVLGDPGDALMLLGFVFVSMGITIFQERKTERALETLRDLSSPRALVIRNGEQRRIPGREVVRGDLLVLEEGDRVPADRVPGDRLPVVDRTPAVRMLADQMLADQLAGNAPIATRYILDVVNRGLEMPFADAAAYEATLFGLVAATDDMREGTRAFLEKRKPAFKGQ